MACITPLCIAAPAIRLARKNLSLSPLPVMPRYIGKDVMNRGEAIHLCSFSSSLRQCIVFAYIAIQPAYVHLSTYAVCTVHG